MTRARSARTGWLFGWSSLRLGLSLAGMILVLGLLAQGWAWIDPPPPPTQGPVSSEVTVGGLAAAAAVILLWVMLPVQLLVTALFAAFPSLGRKGGEPRR